MTSDVDGRAPARVEELSEGEGVGFVDDWYEYADPDHFWIQWRFEALLRLLSSAGVPLDRPVRALDIGGGRGVFRDQLEARTPWTVDCADLNREALGQGAAGRGRTLFYDIVEQRPELSGAYELVSLLDVVEHVEPTRAFVEAAAAHVAPGGWLLINVPALQSMYSRFDECVGHHRRYNARTLRAEVEGLPFESVTTRYWGFSMLPILAARRVLVSSGKDEKKVVATGFKPPRPAVSAVIRAIMRGELALLRRPPLGTSILLLARRASQSESDSSLSG